MDSVTRRLIAKKFNVPSDIMEIIDSHLIYKYKLDHMKRFPMDTYSDFFEIIRICYDINCSISWYDENMPDFDNHDDDEYLSKWNSRCDDILKGIYFSNLAEKVKQAEYRIKFINYYI